MFMNLNNSVSSKRSFSRFQYVTDYGQITAHCAGNKDNFADN